MKPGSLALATGGTGGHVYPAVAVATAAIARGHQVVVIGQRHGLEERVAAAAGLPFVGVTAGKWDRQRPDPRQALAALRGVFEAVAWIQRGRPDVVVGFGGFASFPGCLAAAWRRVPLVLYEGNAFPGRVVRWFAGRAKVVLISQAPVERHLRSASRIVRVGFPVREQHLPREAARQRLGLPIEALVTLVMGGSQGSQALNRLVPEAFSKLRAPGRRQHLVLHGTGPAWLDDVRSATRGLPDYRSDGYLDATLAWSAADLAITRAGFSTLAEAALHGVPVIAVPLPTSAEDHQRHNAAALAQDGAGRLVEESDPEALVAAWNGLLDDQARSQAAQAAVRRATPGAAADIVDHIETILAATSGRRVRELA